MVGEQAGGSKKADARAACFYSNTTSAVTGLSTNNDINPL
jgi:hypothetical protein